MEMNFKCNVGIDYSTASPCICVQVGEEYDFHYLTRVKKLVQYSESEMCTFSGTLLPKTQDFNSKTHQYDFIVQWAMRTLQNYDIDHVWLEDYAFGATGKVFHIGENTGLLKHKLMRTYIPFSVVPPTVIKKEMIGRGNAKKEEIVEKFIKDTKSPLFSLLDTTTMNPASDIADSYFICRYGIEQNDKNDLKSLHHDINECAIGN
jgi:Holliday junction resolvasome RuvABC endonuclease subunit